MNARFNTDVKTIHSQPFVIADTVELSEDEYANFCENPGESYLFLEKFKDNTYVDENGIARCGLVLCKGRDDGILIMNYDNDYARYTSPLPCARQIAAFQKHPSLELYSRHMGELVEHYAKQAVEAQIDCAYRLRYEDVNDYCARKPFDEELFTDMMSERPEIASIEADTDGFDIIIAEAFIQAEEPRRRLTETDVEIMCAKHTLWLNDVGGEQADFSGCYLDGLDLSEKNLLNAKFDNAKLVGVKLKDASLCDSTFNGARFYYCDLELAVAEETECKDARFYGCKLDKAVFTHSDMTDTKFVDCSADRMSFQNSCVQNTDFGNIYCGNTDMRGVSDNQEEWQSQSNAQGINIGGMQ